MLESPEQGGEVLLVIVVIITASMCMDAVVNTLLFFYIQICLSYPLLWVTAEFTTESQASSTWQRPCAQF